MGTVVLGATELVLVALFAIAVAADNTNINETACLLLHCAANLLVWANEIYAIVRGRDPHDIAYIIISTCQVIITALAFGLFAFYLAETGSEMGVVNFATLGAPAAYCVLVLSWLVTMLAIQSLVFAGADKYHASFNSSSLNKDCDKNKKPTASGTIDWTQRPLPVTIVNVVQNGDRELYRNPAIEVPPSYQPESGRVQMKTTYNHWPGEV